MQMCVTLYTFSNVIGEKRGTKSVHKEKDEHSGTKYIFHLRIWTSSYVHDKV